MKAIVQNDYGSPDVFELKEIDKPAEKWLSLCEELFQPALPRLGVHERIQVT